MALTADLVALAEKYGAHGYRKISALLKAAGWLVNDKRVERIWRREGLKVPARQPKRGRIGTGTFLPATAGGASRSRLVLRLRRGAHP